jgi:hypothetical protein
VVLAGIGLADPGSHGASSATPAGLPLYQFVDSGSGPLPWNAQSLENAIAHTTMLGGPHAASSAGAGAIAYRATNGHLDAYIQGANSSVAWADFSSGNSLPTPAADPIPFFDPAGNLDLLYVDTDNHVIVVSRNDTFSSLWRHLHGDRGWRAYVATDLSAISGVAASNGLASIQMSGLGATVSYRTIADDVEVVPLGWSSDDSVPYVSAKPDLFTGTSTITPTPATTTTTPTSTTTTVASTTTTTATTVPSNNAIASDPIVLPGPMPAFATISTSGDLMVYTNANSSLSSWSALNVTALTKTTPITGTLSLSSNGTNVYLAGLTASGDVELFTSALKSATPTKNFLTWSGLDVTASTSGAPPLSGSIVVDASTAQVAIAGQAANWGDLFAFTNTVGAPAWTSTDVSVTGGASARSVGGVVTATNVGTSLMLYAAGVSSPPRQGVGVYAIPSSKWGQAITDGWPIVSETGGLGTQSSPWVSFTSTKSVTSSPDFLMGQSIYNSHRRVTWLSFWTVSGPLASEAKTTTNYYAHGYTAGAWVAQQIDQYRSLGVGLKPDWVIFDPEGYPDNHSGLDAPGGSSTATIARFATYWKAMTSGWAAGILSVDPSLKPGVYVSQSEYRNYSISTSSLPIFIAVAFGNGGPVPVAGASGSNIRGFISFSAVCSPTSTLLAEEKTLLNPPWAGEFNTLQFNAGIYCKPAPL